MSEPGCNQFWESLSKTRCAVPQMQLCVSNSFVQRKADLKGYFTSGKVNVFLKWVIYVEKM